MTVTHPIWRRLFEKQQQKGFTLIELLVVITIISLMIAVLLPALKNAREASRAVSCSSGMRQIGQATHMYAINNNDWVPLFTYWCNPIEQYLGVPYYLRTTDDYENRAFSKVWSCPTNQATLETFATPAAFKNIPCYQATRISYIANVKIFGQPANSVKDDPMTWQYWPHKLSSIRNASDKMLLLERVMGKWGSKIHGIGSHAAFFYWGHPSSTMNILLADSHVTRIKNTNQAFQGLSTTPEYKRTWLVNDNWDNSW